MGRCKDCLWLREIFNKQGEFFIYCCVRNGYYFNKESIFLTKEHDCFEPKEKDN